MTNTTPTPEPDHGHLTEPTPTPLTKPTPVHITTPVTSKPNTVAIISFVLAITGAAIPGIIFGHIARNQIKRYNEPGHNWALAGLIIGYIWLATFVLGMITYFAFLILIITVAAHHGTSTMHFDTGRIPGGRV